MRAAAATLLEQADALLYGLDEFNGEGEEPAPVQPYEPIGDCSHPPEKRAEQGTMHDPAAFFCTGCKHRKDELTPITKEPA